MAPRRDTPPHRDNRNNDGARNRQLLNAHTGAGVNANRPAAIRGRGGGSSIRTRGTSRRGAPASQRGHQRRSPVSTPGRRIAERVSLEDNRLRRVEEEATSGNDVRPQARSEQHPSASISARESIQTRFKQHTSTNVSTQETRARTRSTTYNSFLRASTAPNLTSAFAPPRSLPLPPTHAAAAAAHRRLHDDTAAARRAFSNPLLRAIMSNKPFPRQRKKALAERPILKQGPKKDYK